MGAQAGLRLCCSQTPKVFYLAQASRLECVPENYFSHFSTKTNVVGTQKIRLD